MPLGRDTASPYCGRYPWGGTHRHLTAADTPGEGHTVTLLRPMPLGRDTPSPTDAPGEGHSVTLLRPMPWGGTHCHLTAADAPGEGHTVTLLRPIPLGRDTPSPYCGRLPLGRDTASPY
uniref:Uncharacterized protein n=1 Tax=Knipowitschia caucasica TaxID=637954 RepID=A0AAV2LCJ5_KNICA